MFMRSALAAAQIAVKHDKAKSRFIGQIQDVQGFSVLEYRLISPAGVDFYRTFTDPALQGKGAAAAVVKAGLQWARESSLKVKPSCSYVEAFVLKNPEWSDLISKL